jgi:hypothetical protein
VDDVIAVEVQLAGGDDAIAVEVQLAGGDDVIAVEMQLAGGGRRFFVKWGRIQDPVNPDPWCATVVRVARDLGDAPVCARVCRSLREAADTADAPYFYECFMALCRQPIPSGGDFEAWRQSRAEATDHGREVAYRDLTGHTRSWLASGNGPQPCHVSACREAGPTFRPAAPRQPAAAK